MPAPVRVVLTSEEDRTLQELRVATTVPQRTRDHAHVVRLHAPALAESIWSNVWLKTLGHTTASNSPRR